MQNTLLSLLLLVILTDLALIKAEDVYADAVRNSQVGGGEAAKNLFLEEVHRVHEALKRGEAMAVIDVWGEMAPSFEAVDQITGLKKNFHGCIVSDDQFTARKRARAAALTAYARAGVLASDSARTRIVKTMPTGLSWRAFENPGAFATSRYATMFVREPARSASGGTQSVPVISFRDDSVDSPLKEMAYPHFADRLPNAEDLPVKGVQWAYSRQAKAFFLRGKDRANRMVVLQLDPLAKTVIKEFVVDESARVD